MFVSTKYTCVDPFPSKDEARSVVGQLAGKVGTCSGEYVGAIFLQYAAVVPSNPDAQLDVLFEWRWDGETSRLNALSPKVGVGRIHFL